MIVRQRSGFAVPIAIFLALLLIALTVAAGVLWLNEADKRVQAEQKAAAVEKKYEDIKIQCNAMKNSGQVQGVSLDTQQDPIIAGLEAQTEVPQCERPAIQPFAEPMRVQDQKFFANAKEGDVLVTYPLSKIAYLYRKNGGTVVNQARIADPPQAQQPQQIPPQGSTPQQLP